MRKVIIQQYLGYEMASRNIAVIVGIFFLVTLSYVTVLDNTLVADDYYFHSPAVTQNPFRFFWQDMLPDRPEAVFLRPLPILVCALESHFEATFPVLPHITNLAFHLITTAVIGLFIMFPSRGEKNAGQDIFAPVCGMLIFALHPQATGAVDFVTARFDLMCGLFGIIGLYAWLSSVSRTNVLRWRLIAIFAFALSLLSKETGIIFPVTVVFWELWRWITNRRSIKAKSQIVVLCQLAAFLVIYYVYRLLVLGGIGGYATFGVEHLNLVGPAGDILVLFWPFAKIGPMPSITLSVTLILLTVAIVFVVTREQPNTKKPDKSLWLLPVLLCVFPPLLFIFSPSFLTVQDILEHAEARYSYVPLIGFSIMIGWLLKKGRGFRIGRVIIPTFLSLLMCFYIWAQQSEHSRWTNASRMVDSILSQTVALVPQPTNNATLIFDGKLLFADRFYYVFGIGLPEAVQKHYGRSDLEIVRWAEKDMLENPPNNSYVFKFDRKTWKMTLTYPHNQTPKQLTDSHSR